MDYIYDEVDDLLGRGGGAAVYRARLEGASDDVALKRPLPFDLCDERLQKEIQVLAKMSHDHLMPVLAHGVDDDDHPWYTMPLARGSLKKLWLSGEVGDDVDSVCAEVLEHVCRLFAVRGERPAVIGVHAADLAALVSRIRVR